MSRPTIKMSDVKWAEVEAAADTLKSVCRSIPFAAPEVQPDHYLRAVEQVNRLAEALCLIKLDE